MIRRLINDEQWLIIEPFVQMKKNNSGRKRVVDDRLIIEGILYVLSNGVKGEMYLPSLVIGNAYIQDL